MSKTKIGEANVVNGIASTEYRIPNDMTTGKHNLYGVFLQNDTHKRGEGSGVLEVRIKTNIIVYNVTASKNEEATFTAKVTHTGGQNIPAGEGTVQFMLGNNLIGSPQTIEANGIASLTHIIPSDIEEGTEITANFIETPTYAGSVTETAALLHLRKSTNILIQNVYGNRGEEVEISADITDNEGNNINEGTAKLYVDDTLQGSPQQVNEGKVSFNYLISNNAFTGSHNVTIEYERTDNYDTGNGTGNLQIRIPTTLTPINVSGNAQTPEETIPVTINVKDENNNPVASGSVGITIGSGEETIVDVNASGEATTSYSIPSNASGTIHFSARFIEDNNYEASTTITDGIITIRKGTVITLENIKAVRGDDITLTATVKDTENNDVDMGTVEFEVE